VCAHGYFVRVQSEWTTYVNPWTRRVELLIGTHRIVEPPQTSNIFDRQAPLEPTMLTELERCAIVDKLDEALVQLTDLAFHRPSCTSPTSVLHAKQQLLHHRPVSCADEQPLSLVVNKSTQNSTQLKAQHLANYVDGMVEAFAAAAAAAAGDADAVNTMSSRVPLLLSNALVHPEPASHRTSLLPHSVSVPLAMHHHVCTALCMHTYLLILPGVGTSRRCQLVARIDLIWTFVVHTDQLFRKCATTAH
jgi:hypothetical protein